MSLRVSMVVALAVAACGLLVSVGNHVMVTAQVAAPRAGVGVMGTVVDDNLQPIADVDVALLQATRVVQRTTTNAEGQFSFVPVSVGRYQVRASKSGIPNAEREFVVAAGSETVRLPLVMSVVVAAEQPRVGGAGRGAHVVVAAPPPMRSVVGGIANAPSFPQAPPPPAAAPVAAPSEYSHVAGRGGAVSADAKAATQELRVYQGNAAGGEGYAHVRSNRFRRTSDEPLSTFGADVDTASFTNVRRFLRNGQLPPTDAVRVEEFINYFSFDYAAPSGGHPIGVTTEVGDAPWAPRHKLVLIGARAVAPGRREIAGRNIVLLVDVSGSMSSDDKLPLIKSGLTAFVKSLEANDRLAIVTYAGTTGVALPSTPARERERMLDVIAGLGAGGSTNGAGGLVAAYRIARQAYIPGGVNRVILATDGDFNVGVTSHEGLLRLIEREKESGVFLSVLGVGTGNLQDATMELLADKGNGHYAYLDSFQEARRVLVREAGSTLETVAKDVKFQVEFNPAEVAAWRLVGYENRLLAHEDFNDDRKDGGEMGAGHNVTVLYEVVPVGVDVNDDDGDAGRPLVDPLRYQESATPRRPASTLMAPRGELLTVKVRYQEPEGNRSKLLSHPVRTVATRQVHLPFASAVAEFGLMLRDGRETSRRWDGLVSRLERMPLSGDRAELRDLVTAAASLRR